MVSMVAQVAALFTNQFAMHATKCYIGLIVELTSAKRRRLIIWLWLKGLATYSAKISRVQITLPCCLVHLVWVEVWSLLINWDLSVFKAFDQKFFLNVRLSQVDLVRHLVRPLLILICPYQAGAVLLSCFYFHKGAGCWREKPNFFICEVWSVVCSITIVSLPTLHLVKNVSVLKNKTVVSGILTSGFRLVDLLWLLRSQKVLLVAAWSSGLGNLNLLR